MICHGFGSRSRPENLPGGWILLGSGLLGIITGIVLYVGFPWTGLVVPGLLLGIDMIFHGAWWMALGFMVRRPNAGTGHMAHAT